MGNLFSRKKHSRYQSQAYPPNYQQQPERMPKHPYPPQQSSRPPDRRSSMRYSYIGDNYTSVEEVQRALRTAGLESSNLIVGIDFTKSNEWTGKHSLGGRSLHAIGAIANPYEQALSIIGRTLSR